MAAVTGLPGVLSSAVSRAASLSAMLAPDPRDGLGDADRDQRGVLDRGQVDEAAEVRVPAPDRPGGYRVQALRGVARRYGEPARGSGQRPHQVAGDSGDLDVRGDPGGGVLRRLAEVEDAGGHADASADDGGEAAPHVIRYQRAGLGCERRAAVDADVAGLVAAGVREVLPAYPRGDAVGADQDVCLGLCSVLEGDADGVIVLFEAGAGLVVADVQAYGQDFAERPAVHRCGQRFRVRGVGGEAVFEALLAAKPAGDDVDLGARAAAG